MSIIGKLFLRKSREVAIRENIKETKESILRLEILMEELDAKDAEAKSHEKLLQIAVDDVATAIWGKNLLGHFVFLNETCAAKILKTTVSDAMALTDEDFEHDALAGPCMASDKVVIETGKTHRQIEYARYDDGHFLYIDSTKSPWIVNGETIGTVGFGRDVSKFVPDEVKESYKKPGFIEIQIELIYNSSDIMEIFKNV